MVPIDAVRRVGRPHPSADARQALRDRLRQATAASLGLCADATGLRTLATEARLASRPRGHYARVTGTLMGRPVTGLVRKDGAFAGHAVLLALIRRGPAGGAPAKRGSAGRASAGRGSAPTPIAATLRLARACDAVTSVEFFRAGQRDDGVVSCVAMDPYFADSGAFSVTGHDIREGHVVYFYGELDMSGTELAEETLVRAARSTVVLDLSGLTFLDASGLRAIVAAKQRIEADGNKFCIRGAFGIVRRVFEITELVHYLEN